MNDFIEQIKNNFKKLNLSYENILLEEEKLNNEHDSLLDDYALCRKAYYDSCDTYTKFKNKLDQRRKKYISKKHIRHINLVMLITLILALSCAGIYSSLGFVSNKFLLYCGSAILSPIAGMVDINLFWNKLREKYANEFDELDSTKNAKEILDKFNVQKLRNEKEFNDKKDEVNISSKKLSDVFNKRKSIESEINQFKIKFFEDTIAVESALSDENKLILSQK